MSDSSQTLSQLDLAFLLATVSATADSYLIVTSILPQAEQNTCDTASNTKDSWGILRFCISCFVDYNSKAIYL